MKMDGCATVVDMLCQTNYGWNTTSKENISKVSLFLATSVENNSGLEIQCDLILLNSIKIKFQVQKLAEKASFSNSS